MIVWSPHCQQAAISIEGKRSHAGRIGVFERTQHLTRGWVDQVDQITPMDQSHDFAIGGKRHLTRNLVPWKCFNMETRCPRTDLPKLASARGGGYKPTSIRGERNKATAGNWQPVT